MKQPKLDPKTPAQLQNEIAYFQQRKAQTTSQDRIKRAESAIRVREKQLKLARKVRAD